MLLAGAHDTGPTRVDVRLEPGTYRVDIELHAPAYPVQASTYWPEQLAQLPESFTVAIDGVQLEQPVLQREPAGLSVRTWARYQGDLPLAASELVLRSAHATGPWLVMVRNRGELGDPLLMGGGEVQRLPLDRVAPQALGTTIGRYLWLGYIHILPRGLDHILFVLGLFLLARRARPLLIQISAFTLAHTITLGAGLMGWVQLSGAVVEPLIAASIVLVGVENVAAKQMTPWRPVLVFAFGLLHGLGFAGVLTELGLPPGQRLVPLLAFNVGVELGQLTVVLAAFALVGRWWNAPWYRERVVVPGSIAIALVGAWWTVERLFLG